VEGLYDDLSKDGILLAEVDRSVPLDYGYQRKNSGTPSAPRTESCARWLVVELNAVNLAGARRVPSNNVGELFGVNPSVFCGVSGCPE
jgi:hypothetical protein